MIDAPSLIRACADCEQQLGILNRGDGNKTHGTCQRHFRATLRDAGFHDHEIQEAVDQVRPGGFCEDLGA